MYTSPLEREVMLTTNSPWQNVTVLSSLCRLDESGCHSLRNAVEAPIYKANDMNKISEL